MKKLKISFLETETLSLNRSKDGIKGYEPAIIKTEKGTFKGKVIDVNRLKQAKQTHHELYSTVLDLKPLEFDLSLLLEADEKGKIWLDKFNKYFYDNFKEHIPTDISIKELAFPVGGEYTLYPNDIELIGKINYRCPKGKIKLLSDKMVYYNILPPMKFKNEKWIPNIYYNRKVDDIEGFFRSYSLHEPAERYLNARGVLLGTLKLDDIENKVGDFRKSFPMPHFLEIAYPVSLRDNKNNPLSIRFDLV